jgi:tetratricopeptide (TPR) repeat protein
MKNRAKKTWEVPSWVAPTVVALGLTGFTVWAWPARDALEPRVRDGNSAYAQRDYPGALGHYEAAPGDSPRNAGVHMNRGLARFRSALPPMDGGALPEFAADAAVPESWQRAQDEMRNAARGYTGAPADDIAATLRAQASYNLANTYFAQHLWQNAIDSYKEALRLHPGHANAAWNLELARRRKEDDERPDASDGGQDAAQDGSNDGGGDGGGDGGQSDGGSQSDGGQSQPDGGSQPDSGNDGGGGGNDAGTPPPPQQNDAGEPPPASLAPLDQLERNAQDLQQMLLRRRAAQTPRSPDDER